MQAAPIEPPEGSVRRATLSHGQSFLVSLSNLAFRFKDARGPKGWLRVCHTVSSGLFARRPKHNLS